MTRMIVRVSELRNSSTFINITFVLPVDTGWTLKPTRIMNNCLLLLPMQSS